MAAPLFRLQKPEKAFACPKKDVRPSVNECGEKPILPELRSVKKANSYQSVDQSEPKTILQITPFSSDAAFNQQITMRIIIPKQCILLAAIALAILTTTTLRGGQITGFSWYSGVASVASTSIDPLVAPNNDDAVGASPNTVFVTQKHYVGIGPVDLVFDVSNSGGVTEYLFTEGVFNDTGLSWGSYHLELGFGHDAGYVRSASADGLDFDSPDFNSPFNFNPSGSFFPSVTVIEDEIFAAGGVMPNLTFAGYFRFTVDVPDGITSFTIRQSPVPIVVPEPGSFTISICGIAGFALWRRRS